MESHTSPTLRPLLPGDEPLLQEFFARLSADEVRHRFGHAMRELPEEWVRQWCSLDDRTHLGWGLFSASAPGQPAQLHGLCQAFVDFLAHEAEWAIVLEGAWMGKGWGKRMGERVLALLDDARIHTVTANTAADNARMMALARTLGFHVVRTDDATQTQFVRRGMTTTPCTLPPTASTLPLASAPRRRALAA